MTIKRVAAPTQGAVLFSFSDRGEVPEVLQMLLPEMAGKCGSVYLLLPPEKETDPAGTPGYFGFKEEGNTNALSNLLAITRRHGDPPANRYGFPFDAELFGSEEEFRAIIDPYLQAHPWFKRPVTPC